MEPPVHLARGSRKQPCWLTMSEDTQSTPQEHSADEHTESTPESTVADRPMQEQNHGTLKDVEGGAAGPSSDLREDLLEEVAHPLSTPDAAEEPAERSSPRFSYTNDHSSGKALMRGEGVRREELLEKALCGEISGETMVRMDARAGGSGSGRWRRFDELLRDPEAVLSHLGMTLGQLCAAGYGRDARTNAERERRQEPADCCEEAQSTSASPADTDQVGRRRAMASIASSLTRQLFAKNFARSDLVSSPLRSACGSSGTADGSTAEPVCAPGPSTPTDAAAPATMAHTPSVPFMQASNVPSAPVETARGASRLPSAVSGPRIDAFRELSGAGSRKLGYIASAVSSQLAAVGSVAVASASSATAPATSKAQSAAAARAALINGSTGLDYSPTSSRDNYEYVLSGGF